MSSGGSYAKFYDVGGQYKNLTPKFDSLKLPGGKYDETNFLDWLTRVGNVVRNHPPVGLNIEEFLDVFLNRGAVRVNTLPDWIMSDPSLRVDVVSDTISRSMGAQSRQSAPLGHTHSHRSQRSVLSSADEPLEPAEGLPLPRGHEGLGPAIETAS